MTLFDESVLEEIATLQGMREPLKRAMEKVAWDLNEHAGAHVGETFEGVVDIATAVGKTRMIAAGVDYFARCGVRNFAVIVPGKTIHSKTVANFTPGHPKSLLPLMETRPVIVTADNFDSASMRADLDDDSKVKLFVFTVQSLLKPTTKTGRKTHEFREGLGKAFYAHLESLDDLIVFADEHHVYYGPQFSNATRGMEPLALIGLTATPHPNTPEDQIIYRYPLAAAIAERYVKIPVIVGRKDDNNDARTKLLDGARLLDTKQLAAENRAKEHPGEQPVKPIMLVVAADTTEAAEYRDIVESTDFLDGRYTGTVLQVDSKQPDDALAALDRVEEPGDPTRIIISVQMLKEGWDCASVYVICSMRASVSDILTEQTLGRGLRLPYGRYTDWEILDTLEVLAHERFEKLLARADVLRESFIDRRTVLRRVRQADGSTAITATTEPVEAGGFEMQSPSAGDPASANTAGDASSEATSPGGVRVEEGEQRQSEAEQQASAQPVKPREDLPAIELPEVVYTEVAPAPFSLSNIENLDDYVALGKNFAANPEAELRRTKLEARVVTGSDGIPYTEFVQRNATDAVASPARLFPIDEQRDKLIIAARGAQGVPGRTAEKAGATRLADKVIEGLGSKSQDLLSSFHGRITAALIEQIDKDRKRIIQQPTTAEKVRMRILDESFAPAATTSDDRHHTKFARGVGYTGWKRSIYPQTKFDSAPELRVANVLDESADVRCWARLRIGMLRVQWKGGSYNPDFVAVENDGTHFLIEVKANRDAENEDVQAKRTAARRWAQFVTDHAGATWQYVFVTESDIIRAKDSWSALKAAGA